MTPFDFHPRTQVIFGPGSVERLGELTRGLSGSRALVVSDPGIDAAGHLDRGVRSLEAAGISVVRFTGVQENPTTRHVDAALDVAKRHQIDCLVGLGGGSSMDTAKGVNFLYTNGGRIADYWGVGKATKPMLPMIAVPTTAGTGSEAQSFTLIADELSHRKMACGDQKAACKIAILDPETTVSQPARVTAVSGIDAISHALETWITTKRNAMSMVFSCAAWELLAVGLPRVLDRPTDIEARGQMLLGAHFAGAAIENSMLGATHAAANPLTARFNITHGAAIGTMLAPVMRFNAKSCEPDFRRLAGLLGSEGASKPVEAVVGFVQFLMNKANLPTRLADYGIREADFDALANDAAKEWTAAFNPRPVSCGDFVGLYRAVA